MKTLINDLQTINSNKHMGVVLPSHVSESCITDTHDSLTVTINSMPDASVFEMTISGTNGMFETPAGSSITFGTHPIRNLFLDMPAVLDDTWCSSYTPVTSVASPNFNFDCAVFWGGSSY